MQDKRIVIGIPRVWQQIIVDANMHCPTYCRNAIEKQMKADGLMTDSEPETPQREPSRLAQIAKLAELKREDAIEWATANADVMQEDEFHQLCFNEGSLTITNAMERGGVIAPWKYDRTKAAFK